MLEEINGNILDKEVIKMCEFVSWIEYENKILFLDDDKLLRTEKGRELTKYLGKYYWDDVPGHGAIMYYFNLGRHDGIHKECINFETQDNFPKEIVKAIEGGKFRNIGHNINMLADPAKEEYKKAERSAKEEYYKAKRSAWKEYDKVGRSAWKEYDKVGRSAKEEYDKVVELAWEEYDKVGRSAKEEYDKVVELAWEEYKKAEGLAKEEYYKAKRSAKEKCDKVGRSAKEEYDKVVELAWEEYKKAVSNTFWDLFSNPNNRRKGWR